MSYHGKQCLDRMRGSSDCVRLCFGQDFGGDYRQIAALFIKETECEVNNTFILIKPVGER